MTVEEWDHVKHWRDPVYGNIFIVLTVFIVRCGITINGSGHDLTKYSESMKNTATCSKFFLSILAATLPVPTGVLIPSFMIGAAFGRMVRQRTGGCTLHTMLT